MTRLDGSGLDGEWAVRLLSRTGAVLDFEGWHGGVRWYQMCDGEVLIHLPRSVRGERYEFRFLDRAFRAGPFVVALRGATTWAAIAGEPVL